MQCISKNKYEPYGDVQVNNLPARVFAKAVTRMGFKYYEVPTKKEEQWEAFINNWLVLYRFTKKNLRTTDFELFIDESRKLCVGYEIALIRNKVISNEKVKCCFIADAYSDEELKDRRSSAGFYDEEYYVYKIGSVCDIFN